MNELTRCNILGCVGAGSTVAAAGCIDTILDPEPDEARLGTLEVRNMGGHADIKVAVAVEEVNGEAVFSDAWEIEQETIGERRRSQPNEDSTSPALQPVISRKRLILWKRPMARTCVSALSFKPVPMMKASPTSY